MVSKHKISRQIEFTLNEFFFVFYTSYVEEGGKRKGKEGGMEERKKGNSTYCTVSISKPQLKHFRCKILHVVLVTDIQGNRKAEFSLIQLILRIP